MGLLIRTDDRGLEIHRKDGTYADGRPYTIYSRKVASKQMDGSYTCTYQQLKFKKGVEFNDKAVIKINNCFEIVIPSKKTGGNNIGLFIMDYDVIDEGEVKIDIDDPDVFMSITGLDKDTMPFQ